MFSPTSTHLAYGVWTSRRGLWELSRIFSAVSKYSFPNISVGESPLYDESVPWAVIRAVGDVLEVSKMQNLIQE